MPDISFPEVRLPELKLPEGLREMNREDIQKALPEVHLPKIELPKRGDVSKELAKAAKGIDKAGKEVDKALPRRAGPSPIPFVVLGVIAGLFAGWFLATSPTMAPRIGSVLDALRERVDRWRNGSAIDDEDLELGGTGYPDALRSPLQADTSMTGSVDGIASGVAVGPGGATNGIGAGAEGVSSERF